MIRVLSDGGLHYLSKSGEVYGDIVLGISGEFQVKTGMENNLMRVIWVSNDKCGEDGRSCAEGKDQGSFKSGNEVTKEVYPCFAHGGILVNLKHEEPVSFQGLKAS